MHNKVTGSRPKIGSEDDVVVSGMALSQRCLLCSRSQALPGNVLFARLRLNAAGGAGKTVRYQAEPGNKGKLNKTIVQRARSRLRLAVKRRGNESIGEAIAT